MFGRCAKTAGGLWKARRVVKLARARRAWKVVSKDPTLGGGGVARGFASGVTWPRLYNGVYSVPPCYSCLPLFVVVCTTTRRPKGLCVICRGGVQQRRRLPSNQTNAHNYVDKECMYVCVCVSTVFRDFCN